MAGFGSQLDFSKSSKSMSISGQYGQRVEGDCDAEVYVPLPQHEMRHEIVAT